MKAIKRLSVICLCYFLLNPLMAAAEYQTISKDVYYDKTLACVLGHVAGVLTGFEFVKNPETGLPDEWFQICYGPYGGGPKHGSAGENRVEQYGRIKSDDDYHIDFFNQLIFDKMGANPASYDIYAMWMRHQVSDWGGGYSAMQIMNQKGFIPPFTGRLEYGNVYGWCTESYIENETVGCVCPGMPNRAHMLTNRFASVTGDFESQYWGAFFGTMYAVAYFENNAVTAMEKASVVIPKGSWAEWIYNYAHELHQTYPNNWRTAAAKLAEKGRKIFLLDNKYVAYDINCGFTVLSILYGNNDYLESMKISSLIGYDGDCTAATVSGVMGIVKGMAGTPQKIKDVLYVNGTGVYINDMNFTPHINNSYPAEQKFTDLAALYQSNAEKQIVYNGGSVENDVYRIPVQEVEASAHIPIANSGFESGTDNLFTATQNGGQAGRDINVTAHNGDTAGRLLLPQQNSEAKIYFKLQNLVQGKQYRLSAYLLAKGNNEARLFIQQGSEYKYTSSYINDTNWFYRFLDFTATGEEVQIGLHGINLTGQNTNLYIDDVALEEFPAKQYVRYEAENLAAASQSVTVTDDETASGGKYLTVTQGGNINGIAVTVPETGEYMLRINYANKGINIITGMVTSVSPGGKIPFSRTGSDYRFSSNTVEMPVKLRAGDNSLSIENISGELAVDWLEVVSVKDNGAIFPTGIKPAVAGEKVKVYPTIANESVYVDAPAGFHSNLSIFNLSGNRLFSSCWEGAGFLDISSFPAGLLILNFNNTAYSYIQKIIKQ